MRSTLWLGPNGSRGTGYLGFVFYSAPTVTLEEDLKRRDLTINAMAMGTDGTVVDPYGGRDDLQNRVLRHVSESFVEDPVRLLRVARFAAALPDFAVAGEDSTVDAEDGRECGRSGICSMSGSGGSWQGG